METITKNVKVKKSISILAQRLVDKFNSIGEAKLTYLNSYDRGDYVEWVVNVSVGIASSTGAEVYAVDILNGIESLNLIAEASASDLENFLCSLLLFDECSSTIMAKYISKTTDKTFKPNILEDMRFYISEKVLYGGLSLEDISGQFGGIDNVFVHFDCEEGTTTVVRTPANVKNLSDLEDWLDEKLYVAPAEDRVFRLGIKHLLDVFKTKHKTYRVSIMDFENIVLRMYGNSSGLRFLINDEPQAFGDWFHGVESELWASISTKDLGC